jgi:hypothetical protein
MVQLPGLLRATLAEETPPAIDWPPMAQGPVATKFTCNPFAVPFDSAVALTMAGELEIETGPGRERVIVWSFLSTAGGDGGLCRGAGLVVSGTRVVTMV